MKRFTQWLSIRPSRTSITSARRSRPEVEALDDRVQLSTVTWAVDRSGYWDDPTNWSGGKVPGYYDDVVIDRPSGAYTVTFRQGNIKVHSLVERETLAVTGGVLQTLSPSEIAGSLRLA